MNDNDSAWQFFRHISPELQQLYDLAYRHCHEDPQNTLVKLRACALIFIDKLVGYYQLDNKGSLYDKINHPELLQVIPYHVQNKLNFLRVTGNKGAHPENTFRSHKAAVETALIALRTGYKLALWLYENIYQQDAERIPRFIPPDPQFSDKLYRDAILYQEADAQYTIGLYFKQQWQNQQKTEQRTDAHYWLQKAAKQNHSGACYQLGILLLANTPPKTARAITLIEQAASLGNANALYQMGQFALNSPCETIQNCPQQARIYFEQAAEQEHLEALNDLVQMYYEGIGVKQDWGKAFDYAKRAALAGYPSAQFKLAHLYQAGIGTQADEKEALHWYKSAAEAGDADAQIILFKYYSAGEQVEKNLSQALEWLFLADAQAHPAAAYYLGLAYQRGIGVNVDKIRAINLFKRCMDHDKNRQYPTAKIEFIQEIQTLRQQTLQTARRAALKRSKQKIKRNAPCPCGSGKKYKKCCGK